MRENVRPIRRMGLRPSGRGVGGRGTEAETNALQDNRKAALTAKSTLRYRRLGNEKHHTKGFLPALSCVVRMYRRLGEMKKSTPHGVSQ